MTIILTTKHDWFHLVFCHCQWFWYSTILISFLKSLHPPSASFNILNYVSFSVSSTCTLSNLMLIHTFSAKNSSFLFYFNRLPCLWNCLPAISQIKLSLATFHLKNFPSIFNPFDPCSYHLVCSWHKSLSISSSCNVNFLS